MRDPLEFTNHDPDAGLSLSDAFLLEEFREAWTHFRHLETQRMDYLKFFVSLLAATAAVVAAIAARTDPVRTTTPVLLSILGATYLLASVSTLIYLAIRKLRYSLDHYRNVIQRVRIMALPDGDSINRRIWIGNRAKPIPRLFGIQDGAEYLLATSAALLDICAMIVLAVLLKDSPLTTTRVAAALPLLALVLLHGYILGVQSKIAAVEESAVTLERASH